jgi:hypothetical protein
MNLKKVLRVPIQVLYSQHSISFVTCESAHKLDCSMAQSWKGLPMTNTLTYWACSYVTKKMKFCVNAPSCQCYKNTAVVYHGKLLQYKTLLFLGLKYHGNLLSYCSYLLSFQGKLSVINIPMVIYPHSTVITKVMLLYNTEWR